MPFYDVPQHPVRHAEFVLFRKALWFHLACSAVAAGAAFRAHWAALTELAVPSVCGTTVSSKDLQGELLCPACT